MHRCAIARAQIRNRPSRTPQPFFRVGPANTVRAPVPEANDLGPRHLRVY